MLRHSGRFGSSYTSNSFYEYNRNIDRITSIELYRSSDYRFVGMQVTYLMKDGTTQVGGLHGNYQNHRFPYTLSDGEFFIKLEGHTNSGNDYMTNLTLITNFGVIHNVFADSSPQTYFFSIHGGNEIVSIYGNSQGGIFRNVGVYYRDCRLCRPSTP